MQDGSKETIGVYLQNERRKRNIGLQDVAEATGINPRVLKALEEEDREKLPAEVYIQAFYKKYADFMGLSTDEVTGYSQQQAGTKQAKQDDKFHFQTIVELKSPMESSYGDPIRILLIAILIICLGALFYWAYITNFNPMQFFEDIIGAINLPVSKAVV